MSLLDFFRRSPKPSAEMEQASPDVVSSIVPTSAADAALMPLVFNLAERLKRLDGQGALYPAVRAYAMNDTNVIRNTLDPAFRPYSKISVHSLRQFAETYDVLGACIAHLKSEVIKVPIKFIPKDSKDNSPKTRRQCSDAQDWFDTPGGLGGEDEERELFEGRIFDDLLVVGAAAISFEFETVGALYEQNPDSARAVDAATIRPLLDPYGFAPGLDEPAYEQWVMGRPVSPAFTRRDLWYKGLPIFARTRTPYPLSAVEVLVFTIYAALRSDEWNREFFVSGNTPDKWMKMPENMPPEQAKEWMALFDDMLAGNTPDRRKVKVTPGEITGSESRREADFQGFDEWLMTRTHAMMGVNPASTGHNGGQYEANQEAAMDSTNDRVSQLRQWRLSLYNSICRRKGWTRIKCVDDLPDGESKKERAERHQIEIQSGQRTINETRQERGEDPIEGGNVLLVSSSLKPLEVVIAPPQQSPSANPEQQPEVEDEGAAE